MILTTQQQAALDTLKRFATGQTDHSMAVLEGYAGTGKTTLIGELLSALVAEQAVEAIAVAAPTNKAVKVLREKIIAAGVALPDAPADPFEPHVVGPKVVSFGSIHSFLGLRISELEDGTQACTPARDPSLHRYGLVIVDECSMLGTELFQRIVAAKRKALVLFVGDPAQLPPIERGEQLSPTFTRVQLRVVLTEVVRQAADNPIIALSVALRQAIESGRRVDATAIATALPPLQAKAAVVAGDASTAIDFALYELAHQRDARIVAFTNKAVQAYNSAIHHALHGFTAAPFVPGERVIVHSQCDAIEVDGDGSKTTLITSEELTVRRMVEQPHPLWPQVPASKVILTQDDGAHVAVFLPLDQRALDAEIASKFTLWRQHKQQAESAAQAGKHAQARKWREQAKRASGQAWALKQAFASLRHAYAITAHKSQGSTFDTVIVDMSDMERMKSAFQFNRALYVAATRAAECLAIVVEDNGIVDVASLRRMRDGRE